MDVRSAFLKSKLNEDIYMYPSDGLNLLALGQVCKLEKTLYLTQKLRQSPKCWNSCINEHLLNLNPIRSKVDPCLYYKKNLYLLYG